MLLLLHLEEVDGQRHNHKEYYSQEDNEEGGRGGGENTNVANSGIPDFIKKSILPQLKTPVQ